MGHNEDIIIISGMSGSGKSTAIKALEDIGYFCVDNFPPELVKYLANYIDTSIRTISGSLSKLKKLGYVIVKYENNNRRIYLNTEKIPTKVATEVANNRSQMVAESCYHNINNKYKNKYNKFKKEEIVPYWMEHPEVCKSSLASPEEIEEMEKLLSEFKED